MKPIAPVSIGHGFARVRVETARGFFIGSTDHSSDVCVPGIVHGLGYEVEVHKLHVGNTGFRVQSLEQRLSVRK